ncbi:hexokinase [Metallosphaera tengchongensis]|uniref:Hexokinase n=1 Tax=Metallosphaera tengchongensis TaxID=1532350 RepID=A0A6N0NSN6_9CREN|nr:BadF/BadG/BcrA/BcrD ATPase family protein [Metallosphaera tengchongensis]QKQ99116.1 hexokinase [Metallosphaera tengchongensis]
MIVVGVDGGGTKTKATCIECRGGVGTLVSSYETEGSNFHNVGIKTATKRIKEAIDRCTEGRTPDLVVMGLAGLDSRYDFNVLRENLSSVGKEVIMDNDSFFILYGETRGKNGVIAISGTGSVVLGIKDGEKVRAEGAGWFLSDTGSAYWVGRETLRYLTRCLQGIESSSMLSETVMRSLKLKDLDDLIYWTYHRKHRVEMVASISRLVDKASSRGDEIAQGILKRASREFGRSVLHVVRKTNVSEVYVLGGMFKSKAYMEEFKNLMGENNVRVLPVDKDPSMGSVLYGLDKVNCKLNGY